MTLPLNCEKGKRNSVSFAVTPQTVKVMPTISDKCLFSSDGKGITFEYGNIGENIVYMYCLVLFKISGIHRES